MKIKNLLFLIAFFPLITTNTFAQWEWQNPKPQGNALNDVDFLDNSFRIAVGNTGTIMKSISGQNSPRLDKFN